MISSQMAFFGHKNCVNPLHSTMVGGVDNGGLRICPVRGQRDDLCWRCLCPFVLNMLTELLKQKLVGCGLWVKKRYPGKQPPTVLDFFGVHPPNPQTWYFNVFHTGWWFGTFFIFHNIWDNPSHWLIFFKVVIAPPTSIGCKATLILQNFAGSADKKRPS